MDRFYAQQQPGLLLLHAAGNSFERTLAPGETILIKPNSLLFKDSTVAMQLLRVPEHRRVAAPEVLGKPIPAAEALRPRPGGGHVRPRALPRPRHQRGQVLAGDQAAVVARPA